MMASASVETERFAPRPESAAAARHFVAEAIRETDVDADDAMLLTSELVTNAIIHARGEFEVRVTIEGPDDVCIVVANHSPDILLIVRNAPAQGGRGLELIDRVATAWGFERERDAKLVWFRLSGSGAR
jgi:anti-sigma regulatory factor (Ser/Thr protein kinase)